MNDVVAPQSLSVPLLDLKAQYEALRDSIESAIREVCDSQQFIGGPKISELEERIAAYSKTEYGIGVSSGTDALLVALMALNIGPGDEVVTSTYSFFATGGVIARLGARPVFCDIDAETYNLDVRCVAEFLQQSCIRKRGGVLNRETGGTVKALMPVHLFGQMADMSALTELSKEYDLFIVEDAAQAIGAELADGRRAGSIGDIGCFSFFPSKNLGAFGDAGMCVTQSPELAERIRILRLHGAKPKYHHSFIGGNFRLDALQAAVLSVKLDFLDAWTKARQQNAAFYNKRLRELAAPIKTPFVNDGNRHIYNQYIIEAADRDGLQSFLRQKDIGTEVYYPVPLHRQECFQTLKAGQSSCQVAERAAGNTLALPVYPELSEEQQEYVVAQICQFFNSDK